MANTPPRSLRIPDDLWAAALAGAAAEGRSLSEVIRELLTTRYATTTGKAS